MYNTSLSALATMEINRRNLQWVGVGGTGATDRQTDRDREREKEAERERETETERGTRE